MRLLLFFLLLLLLSVHQAWGIQLTSQTMQLKTGNMLGSVGISMAQWDLEFDEDLFYFEAPPCAPGLTREELTASAVAANPCWAGCDFTSSDPDQCGQPFNADPSCQAICDSHPNKGILCDFVNRPWVVIEPDVESPLLSINVNENAHVRFNWLLVEQGFRYEGISARSAVSMTGVALMDLASAIDGSTFCLAKDSPSCFANTCPSFQCFYYGTWELTVGIITETIVINYVGTSSHIIRTFPQVDGNTRLTSPRADAPVTYPVQATPLHTPVQFGVTLDVTFGTKDTVFYYQLTTPYCGFINILHEKAVWSRPTARVAAGVSTEGVKFPLTLATDIIFLNEGIKPVWVCPKAPAGNATVYFAIARYIAADDPPLTNPELHYLTVDYYRPESQWKKFRLGATAAESGYSNFTNFPPMSTWANGIAANMFRLSCPNPANTSTIKYFDCRSGSANYGTCLQFLFGVPIEPWTVSLLPIPTLVSNINPEGFGNVEYSSFQQTASKKLSAFLILELTSDGAVVSQTLGTNWENLWSQCVLHIGGATSIASVDGEWFFADLALEESVPECVYSEFEELSQSITAGIEIMASDPLSAYSERVLIDELTFHDPWQACNSFIASELSSIVDTEVSVFGSTACLSSDSEDPCCNNDLSWTQCCAPRDLTIDVEALALDNVTTNESCNEPSCVEPLLGEYYRAYLTDSIGGCAGPNLNSKLRAPIRVYRDCREAAFGEDFKLTPCVLDSDCSSLAANTSTYCNQVTKECVSSFSDSVRYFFECIADNLPIETRIKLIAINNFKVTSSNSLAAQLQERYGKSIECVDNSFGSPWSFHNDYLGSGSQSGGCPICHRYATDVSHQLPPWCEVRAGSKCTYDWNAQASYTGCATQVCNWDQSDECDTSLVGTQFCGVCEDDAICTKVSDVSVQSSCEDIPSVCFLADGTVRTDLTAAECEQTYSCTLECSGGSCTSQSSCEAVGFCVTDDEIYEAMASSSWITSEPTGFCVLPMYPFNSPDCTTVKAGSLPTSYGCVAFSDCEDRGTQLNCTPNYYTKELCATLSSSGSVWWPRYDKTSCLSKQGCNELLVGIESLSSLGTRLRSPKNEEQCSMCGGDSEAVSEWVEGRWLPGTARAAQWIERAMADRYELEESIDFNALYDDIYAASRAAVSFQLQNNIQCSYQSINSLISKVACACTTDLDRGKCFSGGFITSVGQGEACPLTSNTIVAPPAKLSYDKNDVSSQLQDQCVEFNIDRINSRFFFGEAPPPISTGFVPKFTIRGWNSVVNEKDALVGQVVGDGIQIHFTQNGRYLTRLRVCLLISSNIPVPSGTGYTEYGLGYWTGDTTPATVVPYSNLDNVTLDNGYVCGSVLLGNDGKDASFVPIYYRADWQDQPSARFSDGQLALLYIVASLYAILCAAIVVQLTRLVGVGAWDFNVGTNYIWVLLFFMTIIRAIYIYLVAADTLGQQSTHLLVDFWMMDLPTLLYLICDSVIAMSFLFLLLALKDDKFQSKRYFWITLVLLISLIVAIFVAILLAFNFAVVEGQGSHGPALCSTYTDNSSKATAIRIVYECLLFTIALLLALIGGAIAAKLWMDLREQDGTSSLLVLGCVSSFGILSDSLAFLIYYIVNNPTPYFAIVLIFTEILPIAFLVFQVATKQIKNKQSSDSGSFSNQRTSTRGAGSSGTLKAVTSR